MDAAQPLVLKVADWLRRRRLGQGRGVVAVSGGPDSLALLRLLLHVRQGQEAEPLIVAHLNHQLRGAEADADEAFLRELPGQLANDGFTVRLRCERIDVAAASREKKTNLEATARRLRYAWLACVAQEHGAAWVATGHTADDQAETILHRLLRGAGLRGLRGIAARRTLAPGIDLIRPVLSFRRDELLDFLTEQGQGFRHDSSNEERCYTRNRIRHELLPLLKRDYSPPITALLNRLAEQAEEAYCWMEQHAAQLLLRAELPRSGAMLVFDRPTLAAERRHLVREMFRLVWERESWPADGMGFEAWERLAAVAQGERSAVELSGNVRVRNRGRVVQVCRGP